MIRNYKLLLFWIFLILFLESIFKVFVFKTINGNLILTFVFSISIAIFLFVLSKCFKKKVNHVLTYIGISLITILFMSQFIYYQFYASILSVYSIFSGGGQILQFAGQIVDIILKNWYILLLFLLPLGIFITLDIKKVWDYKPISHLKKGILILISLILHTTTVLSFHVIEKGKLYSSKNLYYSTHAPLLTADKMGLLTMMRLDIERFVFGFTEENLELPVGEDVTTKEEEEIIEEVEYQTEEIDFDSLIENEEDETIKEMHRYFQSQTPSKKNDYTGMFEGKNLIVFVAEAFSDYAIDEELTPTLYKLYQEGFQFKNFYTPLFPVSTADGEYMTDTSLIPKEGVWSLAKIEGNYMPYSYANVFENLGYTSHAYHNNTATYYKRNKYIKTMGYDSFKACKAGLNINCKIWPQSDLEMIAASTPDYINNEKFIAYYMTVSGHLEYTRNGNMMVSKNWSYVKDLPYSNKAKSYLAANIELDRAIAKLLEQLEQAGKLEDTVIAISGDHYPYGLTIEEINELSTYERDSEFEIHHMPFLIWNSGMEEPVEVLKYGSSLDVLPTLLNLFGIEFDSRLLMGRDLLSDSPNLVIFSNRSFITDLGKYNAITKTFESFNNEVDSNYIDSISLVIYNKFKYSRLILEKDYYKIVFQK